VGSRNGPYKADFPRDSKARVKGLLFLESFKKEWRFHHPLSDEQLNYAANEALVVSVAYYHGGDELYTLKDIPGIWHERCLDLAKGAAEGISLLSKAPDRPNDKKVVDQKLIREELARRRGATTG